MRLRSVEGNQIEANMERRMTWKLRSYGGCTGIIWFRAYLIGLEFSAMFYSSYVRAVRE